MTTLSPMEVLREYQVGLVPRLAFRTTSRQGVAVWQTELRAKMRELLGLDRMEGWRCEPYPEEEAPEDVGDYTRQRVTVQTAPGYRMPMFVLRPKGTGPFVPVIAMHGHGYGKRDVCGMADTPDQEAWIRQINYAYAVEAVRRGYLVFAPDKRGFGETVEPEDLAKGANSSCLWHTMSALLQGMTQVGVHVWDNQRLIDYIGTREDCLKGRLGCFGVSGGGQGTLFLSAVDERVTAAVVSGHLGSLPISLFHHYGCICNTIPGVLEWATKGDIAGLIAPRPLLVESADDDECYSRDSQLDAYATVQRVYGTAEVGGRLDIDLFKGAHQWSGRKAWDWLAKWL